jgi:hypothetical protein
MVYMMGVNSNIEIPAITRIVRMETCWKLSVYRILIIYLETITLGGVPI